MILLTVIAVGLLTLSGISLRSSSQGEAMATARANARMALMMAIGDLQKQLGPDQRISTTADQIATTANPTVSSTPAAQRHWTGAYKAWLSTETARPTTPTFLQWLVSGDPNSIKPLNYASSLLPATANTSIDIVTQNSAGLTGDSVRVPVISQTVTGATNRFA
jgi:hypothetical protein